MYEQTNEMHQQNQVRLNKINEQEYFKGKDFPEIDAEKRSNLKQREDELSVLKYELDQMMSMNGKFGEDQQELQSEIEALKRHVSLLSQQNFEVSLFPCTLIMVVVD